MFRIGGSPRWTHVHRVNYNRWASARNFKHDDVLVFKYNKRANKVLQVSRDDYYNCNTTSPISVHSTGHDKVRLTEDHGHYYFIDGLDRHCKTGQKIDIRVRAHLADQVHHHHHHHHHHHRDRTVHHDRNTELDSTPPPATLVSPTPSPEPSASHASNYTRLEIGIGSCILLIISAFFFLLF